MNKLATFSPIEHGGGGGRVADAPSTREDVSELLLGVGEGSRLALWLLSVCGLTGWLRDVSGL